MDKQNCELNRRLCVAFPMLRQAYDENVSWQFGDRTGSHVVYGDVLNPYIRNALASRDLATLKKVGSFIEEILALNSSYGEEVITVSVIEHFLDDADQELFRECLGAQGSSIFDNLKRWYRDNQAKLTQFAKHGSIGCRKGFEL